MGFNSRNSESREDSRIGDMKEDSQLDPETVARIDNALEGTIDVDIGNLSPDDKLSLLIDRYNRKMRELQQLKGSEP